MSTRNKNRKKANSPNPRPPDPHPPDDDSEPPTHVETVPEPREETNAEDDTMDIATMTRLLLEGLQQMTTKITSEFRQGLRENATLMTEEFRDLRQDLQGLQDTIVMTNDPTTLARTIVSEIRRMETDSNEQEPAEVESGGDSPEEAADNTGGTTARNTQSNSPQSMFVIGRYPMYSKEASNNLGKYTKQLQSMPPANGDDLRSLESCWDSHVNVLNAALNSSNVLPAYQDL